MILRKTMNKLGYWGNRFSLWWEWSYLLIILAALLIVGIVFLALYSNGVFFKEVENYDFTAVVTEKEHYTTQTVTYIKSGETSIPVYHTHHHYKVYWKDGKIADAFEIGIEQYDRTTVGDFINVHCSVREDKQGELHYYYSNGRGN